MCDLLKYAGEELHEEVCQLRKQIYIKKLNSAENSSGLD